MNDETPPVSHPAEPTPARVRDRRWWTRTTLWFGHLATPAQAAVWLGELATVFIGVYAAFLLNNHASHRREHQRREQLLTWVEDHYKAVFNNSHAQNALLRERIRTFNAKLAAGQMPEIKPISWQGDYDPSDMTTLLQSGGFDLLDIETIRDLRDVESALRQLVAITHHAEQRSDALILPNLGKTPSEFYDPDTRRLRAPYDWLPKVYEDLRDGFEALEGSSTKLLEQVRAERARGR